MHNFTRKFKFQQISISVILVFIFCLFFFTLIGNYNVINTDKKVDLINDGWTINGDAFNVKQNFAFGKDTYIIKHNAEKMRGKVLGLHTNHELIKVYMDDKLIYELTTGNSRLKTSGNMFNFIQIPENGDVVTIEMRGAFEDISYEGGNYYLGDTNDIILFLLRKDIIVNIINILLFITAFAMLFFYIFFNKQLIDSKKILSLGLFTLFFALWSGSETFMVEWLLNNPIANYYICYYSLFLSPLFLMIYIRDKSGDDEKDKVIASALIYCHLVVIIVLSFLQFFTRLNFIKTIYLFHFIIVLEFVQIIKFILKNKKYNKNTTWIGNFKNYLMFIIMFLVVFIDGIRMYKVGGDCAVFSRIYILIYLLIIFKRSIESIIKNITDAKLTESLKTIAFIDIMTGVKNRNAFINERNLFDIKNSSVISIDVNNLKYFNDNFGHEKGDLLIVSTAKILKNVFDDNVYRIGGDEFVILLPNVDEKELKYLINKMNCDVNTFNDKNIIHVSFACGFSTYKGESDIDELIKKSDKKMYENKKEMKKLKK